MLRLDAELNAALESDDFARAARAQREIKKVQLEKPSAACGLFIQEDCRAATAMLRQGDVIDIEVRIRAARKLGRWLRWRRTAARGLVPAATALEGLLWALRSEPEVAYTAQCALYHAARCADGTGQSVREGPRGTVSRLLLSEPTPFPLCLPKLTAAAAETYERAIRSDAVQDFFSQLQKLTLTNPGYEETDCQALAMFLPFSRIFGRSFHNLRTLKILGFEDCAMMLILPHFSAPRLQSLQIIGACQTVAAQQAILSVLHRHGSNLVELELNVWTEFLCEADEPLVDMAPMPQVKRLTVRAPPSVPWERFARTFPSLEELTFLYEQDFARNSVEVLEDCEDLADLPELLDTHTQWLYRDAVLFARDLHVRGFRRLGKKCERLQEIRLAVADTSYGYDVTPSEDRLTLEWRRDPAALQLFRRDDMINSATRTSLEAQRAAHANAAEVEMAEMMEDEFEDLDVTEEQAAAAGAAEMLQVVRFFDDPSLEAEFGIGP